MKAARQAIKTNDTRQSGVLRQPHRPLHIPETTADSIANIDKVIRHGGGTGKHKVAATAILWFKSQISTKQRAALISKA
jgi:hypothetical protein